MRTRANRVAIFSLIFLAPFIWRCGDHAGDLGENGNQNNSSHPCQPGDCPPCSNGEVTERCQCGTEIVESGYCCDSAPGNEPCCPARQLTYYVDPTNGEDSNTGLSWGDAKATLQGGISEMSGGDRLVIRDGIYEDDQNRIGDVPGGSPGCWTSVRAETDFGVTVDGGFTTDGIIWLRDKQYVEIIGINVRNAGDNDSGAGLVASNSHHIKFINCSGSEIRGAGHAIGFINVQYGLVEGCHAWGSGRYPMGVSSNPGSRYLVFRRNVVRFDYATADEPLACFSSYHQQDVAFQNNIAIDSQANFDPRLFRPLCEQTGTCSIEDTNERFVRGFFTPNGHTRIQWHGNMVLNHEGVGFMTEGSVDHTGAVIVNNVIWDVKPHPDSLYDAVFFFRDDGTALIDHNTFGASTTSTFVRRSAVSGSDPSMITNSIFYGFGPSGSGAIRELGSDYNVFYGNVTNYESTTPGVNDWTEIDPTDGDPGNGVAALLHLLRIEDGSDLDGSASDGGDRGATILLKHGAPGTLWGEPGWNETTEMEIWPWENEEIIHQHFSSYDQHGVVGERGFAVPGMTLTSYVWGYLGNQNP